MTPSPRPTAYLKRSCPHCLKLRIFLTEAAIADRFDFTIFDDGDDTHQALRTRMAEAGQKPSFPAVAFEPGTLTTGTDDLIARLAGETGTDPAALPLLRYYSEGVFKRYVETVRELKELKAE